MILGLKKEEYYAKSISRKIYAIEEIYDIRMVVFVIFREYCNHTNKGKSSRGEEQHADYRQPALEAV
jgi:hypothetical protein